MNKTYKNRKIILLLDIMKRQKKRKKEEYVNICPKCGSINVQTDFSNPVVWDFGTTVKYKCNSCGYLSNFLPQILIKNIRNYRKELKKEAKEGLVKREKQPLVDTAPGFFVGVWEVVIFLIISLLLVYVNYINYESSLKFLLSIVLVIILIYIIVKAINSRKKTKT